MGKTTGGNPTETGKRVGKYLSRFKQFPATKEILMKRVKSKIIPKMNSKIDKSTNIDNHNKSNLKKWREADFMKGMVDWKLQLGNSLLEGSLGVAKTLRALKNARNKKTTHNDRAYKQYSKWWAKKKYRANKPEYKKHVLGETE